VDLNATFDELPRTTFASGGWRESQLGLGVFTVSASGYQSFAANGPDVALPGTGQTSTANVWSVAVPGTTAGDIAYLGQGRMMNVSPMSGSVGEMSAFDVGFTGTSRLVRGRVAAPYGARVASGNGTAFALGGPTALQSLYMAVHVHEVVGSGSFSVLCQSDDNSGMTTPTTRLTSQTFTGIGSQFLSVAGSFSGETHLRVNHTVTSFTSVTFSVCVGVAATHSI
jgi:hypothetical protein